MKHQKSATVAREMALIRRDVEGVGDQKHHESNVEALKILIHFISLRIGIVKYLLNE